MYPKKCLNRLNLIKYHLLIFLPQLKDGFILITMLQYFELYESNLFFIKLVWLSRLLTILWRFPGHFYTYTVYILLGQISIWFQASYNQDKKRPGYAVFCDKKWTGYSIWRSNKLDRVRCFGRQLLREISRFQLISSI